MEAWTPTSEDGEPMLARQHAVDYTAPLSASYGMTDSRMSPSKLFERLGAPLHNVQWSWGAMRDDGKVFLRVWQDETKREDGRLFVRLVNRAAYAGGENTLGYNERLRHLRALGEGAEGYVVICIAEDIHASPRKIRSFERRELRKLGEIVVFDGDEWGELVDRVGIRELLPR